MYLFRAVDGSGQTVDFYLSETRDREAAKIFLQRAMANPDNRPLHVILARDGLRSYPAAVRELQKEGHVNGRCRQRTRRYSNNRIESDHRCIKMPPTSHSGAKNSSDGLASDSKDRGGTDDSKGAGPRDLRGPTSLVRRGHSRRCWASHPLHATSHRLISNATLPFYDLLIEPIMAFVNAAQPGATSAEEPVQIGLHLENNGAPCARCSRLGRG